MRTEGGRIAAERINEPSLLASPPEPGLPPDLLQQLRVPAHGRGHRGAGKPPAAAVPVKAPLKISAKTWGTTVMFMTKITTVPSR